LAIRTITDGLFLPEGQSYLRTLGSLPVILEGESRVFGHSYYMNPRNLITGAIY